MAYTPHCVHLVGSIGLDSVDALLIHDPEASLASNPDGPRMEDMVRSGIPDARAGLDKQDGQAQETTEFPDFYN